MASYMHNPMFGQDTSYDTGWNYDASAGGYDSGTGYTPGYTGEQTSGGTSGAGSVAQWLGVAAGAINLGAQVYNAATGQSTTPAATPVPGLSTTPIYKPPVVAPASGSSNTLLLVGGLGLLAYIAMK